MHRCFCNLTHCLTNTIGRKRLVLTNAYLKMLSLTANRCIPLLDMKATCSKQPDQGNKNQIYCNDVIQQTQGNQYENSGDQ